MCLKKVQEGPLAGAGPSMAPRVTRGGLVLGKGEFPAR